MGKYIMSYDLKKQRAEGMYLQQNKPSIKSWFSRKLEITIAIFHCTQGSQEWDDEVFLGFLLFNPVL